MTADSLARRLPTGVFLRAVSYEEEQAAQWRGWLSMEERDRLAAFGAASRRREFLAGRAAARRLLSNRLDVPPAAVPLRRAADDAVDVSGTDWQVSIAHSGGHALAACAQGAIGVDLEHIEPRDPAIARFLFAPADRGQVEALPYDADAALVLCWTLKETVLKARRTGFRTSPKDLHLTVQPARNRAVVTVDEGRAWTVHFARLAGYWGAVAVPKE